MTAALLAIGIIASALKVKLAMCGRLAQTAMLAAPLFALVIPNALDLGQAVVAWHRISGEVTKSVDLITNATSSLGSKWDSDDGRAFTPRLVELKSEITQLSTASTGAYSSILALGALYVALFTKLAAFVTAMVVYLMSTVALQATPVGPAAKAAAEAGGLTLVTTTAAVVKMLVSGGAVLGVVLAQGLGAKLAFSALTQDTGKMGTPDIQEINLNWDLAKADPVPKHP